ncbi:MULTISPECIES: class II glutamine amidotransferase [unclassified Roseateles]|uniref:class II glutamine amidotransferase n=1 Tax=unclassified Roseateles TaxID=2626991 RepID=UPI0006FB7ED9|nr:MULTISPECIES: class II glutamine amidotransferase [unclassified Roseateles]KQW51248.1 glutamine amidotransferase [Pelomonas sp. Root405]KRA77480.1 glutamine amidotransferase [Pelomonas sp. Root662]
MCRFLAYSGDAIFLEDLVCKPRHSLVRQSLQASEAKTATNGDGFGIGWYGERETPGVYRECMPAWSDENLLALCANVRSRLFMAHVRAATGGGVSRQNCHPFHLGRYLFIHNGQVGDFPRLRRRLEAQLPDELYDLRRGATDSELLFLLMMARMQDGAGVEEASRRVLCDTVSAAVALGITAPLRFSAALADGEQLWALRWASDDKPPSLYIKPQRGGWAIASEPLGDDAEAWSPLARNEVVHVHDGRIERRPLA